MGFSDSCAEIGPGNKRYQQGYRPPAGRSSPFAAQSSIDVRMLPDRPLMCGTTQPPFRYNSGNRLLLWQLVV